MTDEQKALLGDHEAAKRLTEREVLLPCPMCKEDRALLDRENQIGVFWVLCTGCGLQTEVFETEKEARLAWNTRAPILSAEEMEMLKDEAKD